MKTSVIDNMTSKVVTSNVMKFINAEGISHIYTFLFCLI